MMVGRRNPDDFEKTLRRTLHDVTAATRPAPDLADRLLANTRAGGATVVSLAARRRAVRWGLPLLAAATVAVLAVGAAVGVTLIADRHHDAPPATQAPTPTPTSPFTSAPASSTGAPSSRAASSAGRTSPGAHHRPVVLPPAPDHFRAADVRMTDSSHAWAIGDGRCPTSAGNNCPALITTTNGGSSWHAMKLPTGLVSTFDSASCGTNGTVSGPCVDRVLFTDARHGYIWSLHEFYGTADGGRTWTRAPHATYGWAGATQMVASGRQVVRLAVVHPCSSSCPADVQVAAAGSMDWQTVSTGSKPVALYRSTLAVRNGDVYLFAAGTDDSSAVGILRSSDGGRSWVRLAGSPCGPAENGADPFYGEGAVADSGAVIAECFGSGSSNGVRTANAGSSTFSALRPLPEPDCTWCDVVQAESASTMLVSRGNDSNTISVLYVTHDGGRSWSVRSRLNGRGGFMRFLSASDGYVLSADFGSLLVTRDGGASWQSVGFN